MQYISVGTAYGYLASGAHGGVQLAVCGGRLITALCARFKEPVHSPLHHRQQGATITCCCCCCCCCCCRQLGPYNALLNAPAPPPPLYLLQHLDQLPVAAQHHCVARLGHGEVAAGGDRRYRRVGGVGAEWGATGGTDC